MFDTTIADARAGDDRRAFGTLRPRFARLADRAAADRPAGGAEFLGDVDAERIPFRFAAEGVLRADIVAAGRVIAARRRVAEAAIAKAWADAGDRTSADEEDKR